MQNIQITYGKSTGLYNWFEGISNISIPDEAFAGGGFGDIYHCLEINNNDYLPIAQVVKIFKTGDTDKVQHSWNTISKLQEIIITEADKWDKVGKFFLDVYPALIAIPQFIFEGTLNGENIKGYISTNLSSIGFKSFDKLKEDEDDLNEYINREIEDKYTICYHFSRAFNLLMKNKFIHADITADNIFVSQQDPVCAIIDFDSGVVVQRYEDEPSTWGKKGDWTAPEIIIEQARDASKIKVNGFTDMWSVAVAINNLLFAMPMYYFYEISENTLTHYSRKKYKWPEMDTYDKIFNEDNLDAYNFFLESVGYSDDKVIKELRYTFTEGIFTPTLRTTYYKWEMVFKNLIPESSRILSLSKLIKKNQGSQGESGSSSHFQQSYINILTKSLYTPHSKQNSMVEGLVNELIPDLISGIEKLDTHRAFIRSMANSDGLNGDELLQEVEDFIELFKVVIEDNIVTKFEEMSLLTQAKLALIRPNVVDRLISKHKRA